MRAVIAANESAAWVRARTALPATASSTTAFVAGEAQLAWKFKVAVSIPHQATTTPPSCAIYLEPSWRAAS